MGKVPAHRTPYGYKYQRDAVVDQRGRVKVLRAWWEVDETEPDGNLIEGSPASVVARAKTQGWCLCCWGNTTVALGYNAWFLSCFTT
jgi:hypothetical protein